MQDTNRSNARAVRATVLLSLCTALLAACNGAAPPAVAPSIASTPAEPSVPQGSGCGSSIARYRSIQENDLSMGHVTPSVYDKIKSEIAEAERACSAGNEAKANGLIRASKARHGYPA
jgi:hypothetical protein